MVWIWAWRRTRRTGSSSKNCMEEVRPKHQVSSGVRFAAAINIFKRSEMLRKMNKEHEKWKYLKLTFFLSVSNWGRLTMTLWLTRSWVTGRSRWMLDGRRRNTRTWRLFAHRVILHHWLRHFLVKVLVNALVMLVSIERIRAGVAGECIDGEARMKGTKLISGCDDFINGVNLRFGLNVVEQEWESFAASNDGFADGTTSRAARSLVLLQQFANGVVLSLKSLDFFRETCK